MGRSAPGRLLNHLPANRVTATALDAFLRAAGFRMAAAYGRQFEKLLQVPPLAWGRAQCAVHDLRPGGHGDTLRDGTMRDCMELSQA